MRLPWLRISGGFHPTNPYSNQKLHVWSLLNMRTPVLREGQSSGSAPSSVQKTVLGTHVRQAQRKNRNISVKTG